jgi:quercetin dioxygenase-like cupin family protein
MKPLAAAAVSLSLAVSAASAKEDGALITITPIGTQPSAQGSADYFTGSVRVDSLFNRPAPARVGGGTVTFEPGARTAWHTHPLGQTLIVTAGAGLVQEWNGPVREIRPGDVVWIPPQVKHWHGAAPATGMTHIAIAEALDGKAVDWMEKVSDAQYAVR